MSSCAAAKAGSAPSCRSVTVSRSTFATTSRSKRAWAEPTDTASPLFLSERRGHLSRSAVHRVWKAALRAAGLDTRWGVHATRHSYAVEVYRKTRDLRLTQRLLRHSSPAITQVYASLLDDDVRRGVERVWTS